MRLYVLAGLSGLALALTGCGEKAPQEPAAASSSADATPENAPGIALTDAIVQLPVVAGRPGVAYFTVSQGNGAPRKARGRVPTEKRPAAKERPLEPKC